MPEKKGTKLKRNLILAVIASLLSAGFFLVLCIEGEKSYFLRAPNHCWAPSYWVPAIFTGVSFFFLGSLVPIEKFFENRIGIAVYFFIQGMIALGVFFVLNIIFTLLSYGGFFSEWPGS